MTKAKETVETMVETTQKRRQIGILGGNFNPVHHAHLLIADQVEQQLGLDRVYLMPECLPPHIDTKETISAEHRLNMLQLATKDNVRLGIETIELHRGGKSYTYDTMKQLLELNPEVDYYFIIGGDMVEYLPKWYKIDELVDMVQFVAVERPEYKASTTYPVIWVDAPKLDISSSKLREMINKGMEPRYLLPSEVLNYIKRNGLYTNGKEELNV
ncbi:nicotinate-nucleotide adenylyltransferase [Pilibacter termitis]|uniref:Probable nicotinate-nucleotide adenylyltransferase n=1 Tax=Pilibacter termitis TaxID=263852 RepID=A0A1T4KUY2_9ENTE|nr:nicotinate-nucleotide adenylyltransferase [Pilibacter termitis]SJZ46168.1 nicotinate-nucleotide adenylyltransferase [Pilibacter termitis]